MTHHEIDDSKKDNNNDQQIPLIDFNDLKSADTSVATNSDPYGQYRGLAALSEVLNRNTASGASAKDSLRIPDNVACIGDQCNVLSLEDAAREKAEILASPNRVNVVDKANIPDNVECVGNECRVLSPEELAAEKAKHAGYPSVELTNSEKMPENVVCVGGECRTLSPEEAAAEREKMKAAGNNFEVYMPQKGIPDNVKCIGNDCRILTPEEIKQENAALENVQRAASCCANCCIPENVKCIGDKCVKLSPEEAKAERAKLGLGDTVNISCYCCKPGADCCKDGGKCCTPEDYAKAEEAGKHVCACCRVPDNVECIGDQCRKLSPEQAAAERERITKAGGSFSICKGCNCCNGGKGGGGDAGNNNAAPADKPAEQTPFAKPVERSRWQGGKEVAWWLRL